MNFPKKLPRVMISLIKVMLISSLTMMIMNESVLVKAEKIEFFNTVAPGGTTCYLENIGESI